MNKQMPLMYPSDACDGVPDLQEVCPIAHSAWCTQRLRRDLYRARLRLHRRVRDTCSQYACSAPHCSIRRHANQTFVHRQIQHPNVQNVSWKQQSPGLEPRLACGMRYTQRWLQRRGGQLWILCDVNKTGVSYTTACPHRRGPRRPPRPAAARTRCAVCAPRGAPPCGRPTCSWHRRARQHPPVPPPPTG